MQDNLLHGRFLAELTREVIDDLEASKYQHAEYRISIYGRKRVEWDTLAAWICQHDLASDNVLWLIQVNTLTPASSPRVVPQDDVFAAQACFAECSGQELASVTLTRT